MNKIFLTLALTLFSGCATITGIDPTIMWDAPLVNCAGEPITDPVTYNIYYSTSAIPVVTVAAGIPCAEFQQVDTTKIQAVNTTPIAAPIAHLILPNGTYNVAVESVLGTTRGGFGLQTITVLNRPGIPQNIRAK